MRFWFGLLLFVLSHSDRLLHLYAFSPDRRFKWRIVNQVEHHDVHVRTRLQKSENDENTDKVRSIIRGGLLTEEVDGMEISNNQNVMFEGISLYFMEELPSIVDLSLQAIDENIDKNKKIEASREYNDQIVEISEDNMNVIKEDMDESSILQVLDEIDSVSSFNINDQSYENVNDKIQRGDEIPSRFDEARDIQNVEAQTKSSSECEEVQVNNGENKGDENIVKGSYSTNARSLESTDKKSDSAVVEFFEAAPQNIEKTVADLKTVPEKITNTIENVKSSVKNAQRISSLVAEDIQSIPSNVKTMVSNTNEKVKDTATTVKILVGIEKAPPMKPLASTRDVALKMSNTIFRGTANIATFFVKEAYFIGFTGIRQVYDKYKLDNTKDENDDIPENIDRINVDFVQEASEFLYLAIRELDPSIKERENFIKTLNEIIDMTECAKEAASRATTSAEEVKKLTK